MVCMWMKGNWRTSACCILTALVKLLLKALMINFSAQHHLLIEQSLFVYVKNTYFCGLKFTRLETQIKHSHSPVKVCVLVTRWRLHCRIEGLIFRGYCIFLVFKDIWRSITSLTPRRDDVILEDGWDGCNALLFCLLYSTADNLQSIVCLYF